MKDNIIAVKDKKRPYWQLVGSALFFTLALLYFIIYIYNTTWSDKAYSSFVNKFEVVIYLIVIAIGFGFQKSVYINLSESKFRATFEIGPLRLGTWKTIKDPEYISVFKQPTVDGFIFEVNLWYDTNKHWELYEEHDLPQAFKIGFDVSESLGIDLLDATVANNYRWINKEALKEKGVIEYLD